MRFLKKLLVSIYTYLAVFAAVCLILWIFRGDEPSTLIMAVFGAAGVESMVGGILKFREIQAGKNEETSPEETTPDPPKRAE